MCDVTTKAGNLLITDERAAIFLLHHSSNRYTMIYSDFKIVDIIFSLIHSSSGGSQVPTQHTIYCI